MLATVSSVVAQVIDGYFGIDTKIQALLLVLIMAIGLGGYQANIIQFGMDQLHDASTTEIKSFIIWYVWTLLSTGIIINSRLHLSMSKSEKHADQTALC